MDNPSIMILKINVDYKLPATIIKADTLNMIGDWI